MRLAMLLSWTGLACAGTIRFVDPNGGLDTSNCVGANKCKTVQYALGQSVAGDTVQLSSGEYTSPVTLDKNLTLTGAAGANAVFDCGAQPQPILTVTQPSTIANLYFQNCQAQPNRPAGVDGGAVVLTQPAVLDNLQFRACAPAVTARADAALSNVIVRDGFTDQHQCTGSVLLDSMNSGVAVAGGFKLYMSDTQFLNNSGCIGAGLSMVRSDKASMECLRCHFESNRAVDGAAVFAIQGNIVATDSTFATNRAQNGGALNLELSHLTLLRCSLHANSASGTFGNAGAALFSTMKQISITDSNFTANTADTYASALRMYWDHPLHHATAVLSRCYFEDNVVQVGTNEPATVSGFTVLLQSFVENVLFEDVHFLRNSGGGLMLSELWYGPQFPDTMTGATLTGCTFQDNYCGAYPLLNHPVLKLAGPFAPVINNTLFIGHSCSSAAAVITASGARAAPRVSHSQFVNNSATALTSAGVARFEPGVAGVMLNCTFEGNRASHSRGAAGAVHVGTGTTTMFELCKFFSNFASVGSAVRLESSDSKFVDCLFSGNGAADGSATAGGSLYISGPSSPSFVGCNFSSNNALFGGAVYVGDRSTPAIQNCRFDGNIAGEVGGALLLSFHGTKPTVSNCSFDQNHAEVEGGAVAMHAGAAAHFQDSTWGDNTASYFFTSGPGLYSRYTLHSTFERCWSNSSFVFMDSSNVSMSSTFLSEMLLGTGATVKFAQAAFAHLKLWHLKPPCADASAWKTGELSVGEQPVCNNEQSALILRDQDGGSLPVSALKLSGIGLGSTNTTVGEFTGDQESWIHQVTTETSPGELPLCSEVPLDKCIVCKQEWNWLFWVAVIGGPLVVVCILTALGYRKYKIHQDWTVHAQDTQEDLEGSLTQVLLVTDELDSQGYLSFDYFGYGMIDYRRELWLHEELGRGNYGTVRKATLRRRQNAPARYVAVKELHTQASAELIEEAKAMFDLPHHPNVVSLVGVCDTPPCLVTAIVEGSRQLDDYLQKLWPLEAPPAYIEIVHRALMDIASGVAHLHSNGLMHRDLAARNILIAKDGRALVNDFGLSRGCALSLHLCPNCGLDSRAAKTTGSFMEPSGPGGVHDMDMNATYYRAAPENFDLKGKQVHSMASDVFMFGVLAWQALTGIWSFWSHFDEGRGLHGNTVHQITRRHKPRESTPDMYGMTTLEEHLVRARSECYNPEQPVHSPAYSEAILSVLIESLQEQQSERPTMQAVHRSLKSCIRLSRVA